MPKRLSRKADDPAQLAFRALQRVIAITEGEPTKVAKRANVVSIQRHRKDPAAVALGRKGGRKSAQARMEKIAPAERRRIASHAARERWKKTKG